MCCKVYIPKKRGKKFFLTQKIPGIRGNNYTELKNREYNVNIKCERTPNQLPDHTLGQQNTHEKLFYEAPTKSSH